MEGRRRWRDDRGVSAVLGGILMMALMLTLVPGAVMLKQAMGDEMAAQREAAERAAFCARNPQSKAMGCDRMGPLPGYRCESAAQDVFVCVPEGVEELPPLVTVPPGLMDDDGGSPERPGPPGHVFS